MSNLMPSGDVTALFDKDLEHRLNLPTEEGSALPNMAYTSSEFFALEQKVLFRNTWVFAGFGHQLTKKGDMFPVEIAGQPLVLVKGEDEVIRAFHNVCRHRGAKLVDQPQRGRKNFVCPNHSWSYDLTGKLKAGHDEGEAGMLLLRAFRALPKYRPLIKYLSEDGVKVTLQKSENFYMQEQSKNMHLVDEPLLFTIDEKNRQVDLTERGVEFLSRLNASDKHFFIMPDITLEMQDIEEDESLTEEQRREAKETLAEDFGIKSRRLHAISQLLKAYTLF